MAIKTGEKIPSVTLQYMADDGIKEITTDELLGSKKVVLFALPGAFTPTCSTKHVPGFLGNAAAIRAKGVDTIACVSVNDAFVMGAWAADRGTGSEILMLADGNGDFTKAVGLELDASGFGMGVRSQRYAMIVNEGIVTALAVEDGPGLDVSAAEKILAQL
jgi:peroxiredoxin